MSKKIYRVPVYYQMCEYVCVKADSAEQALKHVQDHQDEFKTHPDEAYYMDDSYEVETEADMVHGYDEENIGTLGWNRPGESFSDNYVTAE